jgi:signal transduction histidine kinase
VKWKLTSKVVVLIAFAVILIMLPAITLVILNQQKQIEMLARTRALTLFQMIVVTRQWVSENRDRIEPVPAVATKELSQYADYMADFRFRITSDQLVNRENSPTPFEERAISAIKTGLSEYHELGKDAVLGDVYMFAAPLHINQSCMQCHARQGYSEGEFRGIISVTIPLQDMVKTITSNNFTLIFAAGLGFLVMLSLVSYLLFRLVISPIQVLTNAAGKVRSGEYGVKTNIKTGDEIDELSQAFDMMSEQIYRNEEHLKAKLSQAVEKYVELVDELKEKNEQLDTLNQLKTDLLDSIAHEIKTPLTKILSYAELLNDVRLMNDAVGKERFIAALKRNISSISSMFNDIITMSRLEHGQHTYHKIPIKFKDFVKTILEVYEQDIRNKQLEIKLLVGKDDVIQADGESFYFVLSNIIGNSVKYSYPHGVIEIGLENLGGEVKLWIKDNGVGIPQDELKNVFSRFYRGSNVKSEFPGTGMGLAIVYRVTKEHDGRVEVDSKLGEYTMLNIYLKLY